MRVLLLQDWNPLRGGAEAYMLQLRDALIEAGDDVQLLTSNVSEQARLVADHLAPAFDSPAAKSFLQIHNPFAAATVKTIVRTFQPHLAIVNMFALYLSPSAVFALGKTPYLLLVTDYKCTCPLGHRLLPNRSVCHLPAGRACLSQRCLSFPHWMRDQWRYRRIRKVVRDASAIVSCSNAMRDSLAEQGIDSRPIHLFSELPDPLLPRQPAASPCFLFVGRLDFEKGVDVLLHAFAICHESVPESQLRIIGRGESRAELERLAGRLGLQDRVTFCGWKEPEEINRELSRAWALVAPSRWSEPFGLVALEAIFRGVPAVVPDFGGFAETVQHKVTGLLYAPGDARALSRQLVNLATERSFPEQRLSDVAVAQACRRYSREQHVARLREIIRESIRGPESAGPKVNSKRVQRQD